jgi:hypothetical protein
MQALQNELDELKAEAAALKVEKDNEPDPKVKESIRAELTAIRTQIAALQSDITEQRRGNFLFFVVNFIFSLNLYILYICSAPRRPSPSHGSPR